MDDPAAPDGGAPANELVNPPLSPRCDPSVAPAPPLGAGVPLGRIVADAAARAAAASAAPEPAGPR